jgi:hypothetical protein
MAMTSRGVGSEIIGAARACDVKTFRRLRSNLSKVDAPNAICIALAPWPYSSHTTSGAYSCSQAYERNEDVALR